MGMMNSRRMIVVVLVLMVSCSLFAAGQKEKAPTKVEVSWFLNAGQADQQAFKDLKAAVEKQTGYTIRFNVIPAEGDDFYKKIDLTLMSGDATDIMPVDNEIYGLKYVSNNFVLPVDDAAKKLGVDLDKTFGKYLPKYRDGLPASADAAAGRPYYIPMEISINQCFFNKKIFDDARVPYPTSPWTWGDLVSTAKKITNPDKGIYGLFLNEDYEYHYYFQARQKGTVAYRNGVWDFSQPAFKGALQFFADLGNKENIMASRLEFDTKKLQWDAFMSGKYGMWIVGSWAFQLFNDRTTYPREWQYGFANVPTPDDGSGRVTLGSPTLMGMCKGSKQPEAAVRTLLAIADNYWSSIKTIPAKAVLTAEEKKAVIAGLVSDKDGVTADVVDQVFFKSPLGFMGEKYIGPGSAELSDIWLQEAGLYCIGQKSADDTLKAISERMNEAAKK
jgi:multiple sugar transport system substrate-binding protein